MAVARVQTLLTLDPRPGVVRNSEGSLLPLADGRLAFAYTRFSGGSADNATAEIAWRVAPALGARFGEDRVLVPCEGAENVMSVTLMRLPPRPTTGPAAPERSPSPGSTVSGTISAAESGDAAGTEASGGKSPDPQAAGGARPPTAGPVAGGEQGAGAILLFYLIKNHMTDCHLYVRRSDDEMATWSERVCATPRPGYFVVNNDRVIRLRSGRLVVPAAWHCGADPAVPRWTAHGVVVTFLSDDDGASWRPGSGQLVAPVPTPMGLQEPGVVETADGRVLLWARTDLGCQYQAESTDGGETFGPVGPGPLRSPLSSASLRRLGDGPELLAVYNDHSGRFPFAAGRRAPLVAALSSDDGVSWSRHKLLESKSDGCYCYTSIACLGDQTVLGYCAGDDRIGPLNRLVLTRVANSWLRR